MAKRGKTPSLIGGGAGACKFATALRKRTCKRCDKAIPKGTDCVEVSIPGTQNHKNYCAHCFREVLAQTQQDLNIYMAFGCQEKKISYRSEISNS